MKTQNNKYSHTFTVKEVFLLLSGALEVSYEVDYVLEHWAPKSASDLATKQSQFDYWIVNDSDWLYYWSFSSQVPQSVLPNNMTQITKYGGISHTILIYVTYQIN